MRYPVWMVLWTVAHLAGPALSLPPVPPTSASPWPQPRRLTRHSDYLLLFPGSFTFETNLSGCEVLDSATARYLKVMWYGFGARHRDRTTTQLLWNDPKFGGYLEALNIQVESPCETHPHLEMDESYELTVNKKEAVLKSRAVWGALRGLETFSQLLVKFDKIKALMINDSQVSDGPRFPHRGLLIDTSRHYLPKPIIQKMLTAMESNKMNVLHWHIVDDESFPYSSKLYPSLSAQGAYNSGGFVYTDNDIKEIVEFARLRGIRVVPEFDTPGHTRSWGEGIPNLLTRCYTGSAPNGQLGPINPTDENNYIILKRLFGEIIQLFPDSYLHLGGDEVEHTCWSSNPNIRDFMKTHNMTQISDLEDLHMRRMFDIVNELNTSSVVWQEAFTRGVKLPKSTLVQVWLGKASNLLKMVTSAGYRALLSSCWYLDHFGNDLYGGGGDWKKFYRCDPLDFPGTEDQKRLVLGGEACMWGEYVDETNVLQRVWPRASAAAEKLWSDPGQDMDHVASRLEEHVCRMRRRGIPAQPPNGPSFCA